jgi:hypothetical protein
VRTSTYVGVEPKIYNTKEILLRMSEV